MDFKQNIINKINAKQNFTHNLTPNKNRYIVSQKSVYKGFNPSLQFNLLDDVFNILERSYNNFDSLGGWYDKKTKLYYLDLNLHFAGLSTALKIAKVKKQNAIFDSKKGIVIYLNNI